jgi:hypothetical protein
VQFGKQARTLIYRDEVGPLVYCFDVSQNRVEGKYELYLDTLPGIEGGPFEIQSPDDETRAARSLEAVAAYVAKCGYTLRLLKRS